MSVLMDVWNAIHAILFGANWMSLVAMALIVIFAGYVIENFSSVVTATLIALIAFALVEYALAVFVHKQDAATYATADWKAFQVLPTLTLLAYGLIFAVGIGIAHTARTLILGER
jgi:hypothetical protein